MINIIAYSTIIEAETLSQVVCIAVAIKVRTNLTTQTTTY